MLQDTLSHPGESEDLTVLAGELLVQFFYHVSVQLRTAPEEFQDIIRVQTEKDRLSDRADGGKTLFPEQYGIFAEILSAVKEVDLVTVGIQHRCGAGLQEIESVGIIVDAADILLVFKMNSFQTGPDLVHFLFFFGGITDRKEFPDKPVCGLGLCHLFFLIPQSRRRAGR